MGQRGKHNGKHKLLWDEWKKQNKKIKTLWYTAMLIHSSAKEKFIAANAILEREFNSITFHLK